jgi:hypothetical protein
VKKGKMKVEKKAKGKAILGIAMAAIMLASVLAATVLMGSAVSKGNEYNYIGNQTIPVQKVLIGQDLQFNKTEPNNNFTAPPVVYRLVSGDIMNVYSTDSNYRIYNVNWPTTGSYYVNYVDATTYDAQLSVEDAHIPLKLKVGTTEVTTIAVGTTLTLDNNGINLFPQDRVDLVVISPDGQIKYDVINNQRFTNISVSDLINWYGNGGLKTTGWKVGDYTFQIKTRPNYACGLDANSGAPVGLKITKCKIEIEASKINPWINETIILTVRALPLHNITIGTSDTLNTVFEGGKYDYSGPDTGGPIEDVMNEDGINYYAVHFTDAGWYTIWLKDDEGKIMNTIDITVPEPERLELEVENENKIRVNFSTDLLDDDRVDLKIINPEGDVLSSNPANPSQVFYNITVQTVKDMLINTSGWDSGTHTTWVETNKSHIPGLGVHSNPGVFEIGEDGIRLVPTAFFFDYEPPFHEEDGGVLTIGDDMLLYGTATGGSTIDIAMASLKGGVKTVTFDVPFTVVIGEKVNIKGTANAGATVDVWVDDNLYPELNDIVIEDDGTFSKEVTTTEVGMTIPGLVRLKAWIDCDKNPGDELPTTSADGDTAIWLTGPGITVNLSTNTVQPGGTFTINGTATGADHVDIITISPKGGGGDELYEKSYPEVPGITTETVPVENNSFSKIINVSECANAGKYVIWVSVPGVDGRYGYGSTAENASELIKHIIDVYCGGDADGLRSKTQDQILCILEDATIFRAGSDDLAYITELTVGNNYTRIVKVDIPIQESGSFIDILLTDNLTPGFNEIEAFIDTPFALGENVTDIENNGSSRIFLKSKESAVSLYGGTVIIGNDLTIYGTATGGTSVDIAIEEEIVAIDVPIGGEGEFEVTLPTPATPHTDTEGLKKIKAFIDTAFTVGENISEVASSGDSNVFLVEGVGAGEIGVYAEENEIIELHHVRIVVVGTAGHNITVDSSDHTHTIFLAGVEDTPPYAYSLPFNHIIDEDGVRTYVVEFNYTGTYTITVTDADTGNNDSVDISVSEIGVTFDMPTTVVIGQRLTIKGAADAGTKVDIAVEDYVYTQLNDLELDENKEFSEEIDTSTAGIPPFTTPGSVKLKAYIDRSLGPGAISPYEPKEDGSTTVLMLAPNLTAWLSTDEISQGGRFRISGYAPGSKVVDLIAISPNGGNGTGLSGEPPLEAPNATGITNTKLPVFEGNRGFSMIMDVCNNADTGDHVIFVLNPGINRTYDGVYTGDLLEGIIQKYCNGNPEMLASFTQEEFVNIIRNATVNASGSDDLIWVGYIKVEALEIFDTGRPENPYPSIFGTHNGTITPFYNINVSKMYTYSCPGTGGHTEYVAFYNATTREEIANGSWNGYQGAGDYHRIEFDSPFVLQAKVTYNYTIKTGSYPQIIHAESKDVIGGIINCTKFVDANGKEYNNWIPAIRLE